MTVYRDTEVSVTRSKEQIEKLLKAHGVVATRFTSFPSYAELAFVRRVGDVSTPYKITIKPQIKSGWSRNPGKDLEQAERQVWRVAYWWLKSKFEAIDFGLVDFEQDFLPYMLLDTPSGAEPVGKVFLDRLTGRTSLPQDPFGGLRPALAEGSNSK